MELVSLMYKKEVAVYLRPLKNGITSLKQNLLMIMVVF